MPAGPLVFISLRQFPNAHISGISGPIHLAARLRELPQKVLTECRTGVYRPVGETNNAEARKQEADGEATFIRETGAAQGAEVEAIGLARARGYEKQVEALGSQATALINVTAALADGKNRFVPEVLVAGGDGGALEGLAAALIGEIRGKVKTAEAAVVTK